MYAILDIETTGGAYNQEGIMEIAIYRFDGLEVVDQFISLVNPEKDIQPYVVKLTGINQAMLRLAPKFYEIAKRIVEITTDCIIVAHNAAFDYRVLRLEFIKLGFKYERPTLCTVELAKQLLPEGTTLSLGKLVRSLGIPIADRHRASGDAFATLKLFKLLLEKDQNKQIVKNLISHNSKEKINIKFYKFVESLPGDVGVFYIHDANGDIVYIGSSTNIRKKVTKILMSEELWAKKIQDAIGHISFDKMGHVLIAKLKEKQEIYIHNPKYNGKDLKISYQYHLYYVIQNGDVIFKIIKGKVDEKIIASFKTQKIAVNFRENFVKQLLEEISSNENEEEVVQAKIQYIEKYIYQLNNCQIIFKGRHQDEKSLILIKNGSVKGYTFFNLNFQINNEAVLEKILSPMYDDSNHFQMVFQYLRTHHDYKIVPVVNA